MSERSDLPYAGDISVAELGERLGEDSNAVLIDVRTQAEWAFVGVPDLSEAGRDPLFLEWQSFPGGQQNGQFVDLLTQALGANGLGKETALYFLCRSGARSAAAAAAMTQAGFKACFNIAEGFEGPMDQDGHRGTVSGWKQCGLPWRQS
ncbi:rhodanese-like domain-containing protein [Coralliovum pocilloporae]|uniref:rhodanese-like domain-containing protein n=1 Tax=Coralliovum pocilloporae TaxID=3066369 RepID=UPI0033071070